MNPNKEQYDSGGVSAIHYTYINIRGPGPTFMQGSLQRMKSMRVQVSLISLLYNRAKVVVELSHCMLTRSGHERH